jgi:hypothetical protein
VNDLTKYLEGKTKEDVDRIKKTIEKNPQIKENFEKEIEKNPVLKAQFPSFESFIADKLPKEEAPAAPAEDKKPEEGEK